MDLFDRRLIIQSGKGGTGKTTISAALAVAAAERGKRVLLVELDTRDRFAALFGAPEDPVGYKVQQLRERIFAINLDPHLVAVDFFKQHLKIKLIWRQIVESRIWQYFFEAAPGLKELICMGKIWRLLSEKHFFSGRPNWDCVILDAPATGHGFSLLNVPQAASDILFGPMKKNAEKIRDLIRDPRLTVLNIVSLPEEMPVNEARDFYRQTVDLLKVPLGVLFMNAVYPPLFTEPERAAFEDGLAGGGDQDPVAARVKATLGGAAAVAALARCARSRGARAALGARYSEKARESIPLPLIPIPFVFDADFDVGTLEAVARELERAFARPPGPAPKRTAASGERRAFPQPGARQGGSGGAANDRAGAAPPEDENERPGVAS